MGHSIKLSAQYSLDEDANTLLLILGDMPFISAHRLRALRVNLSDHDAIISSDGTHTSPPLLIAKKALPTFLKAKGDQGASYLLEDLRLAKQLTSSDELRDIDTPCALIKP